MADEKKEQQPVPATAPQTVADIQTAEDEIEEAGYIGIKADPRPNEDYTLKGVVRRKKEGDHDSSAT